MKLTNLLKGGVLAAAVTVGMLGASSAAHAAFVTTYNGVNFPGQTTAQAEWTFTDQAGDVDLSLQLSNTSSIQSSITGFGFDLPGGSFIGVTFDQTNGWNFADNTSLPGLGSFTLCIESDNNNNCSGNTVATGIASGQTFTFGFVFDSALTAAQFESAVFTLYATSSDPTSAVRWQGVGPTASGSDTGPNTPPTTSVPEPGTLALFGAGLLGLAGAMRRRHRDSAT